MYFVLPNPPNNGLSFWESVVYQNTFRDASNPTTMVDDAGNVSTHIANSGAAIDGGVTLKGGPALYLDGGNDNVAAGSPLKHTLGIINNPFTVELAFKANGAQTNSVPKLFELVNGAVSVAYSVIFISTGLNQIFSSIRKADNTLVSITCPYVLDTALHDIAQEWDGTNHNLYLDGVKVASSALATYATPDANSAIHLGINALAGSELFKGWIPHARVTAAAIYGGSDYTPSSVKFAVGA